MRIIFYLRAICLFILLLLVIINQKAVAQRYGNVAAKFDGVSYIAVKPGDNLTLLSGSFTVECWVNTSTNSTCTLFGNTRFRLLLDSTSNGLVGRMQTNATTRIISGDGYLTQNQWNHLACTYDSTSGNMTFYINGKVTATTISQNIGVIAGIDSIYIGNSVYGGFIGMLDDIRIWNRALSQDEIINSIRIPYADNLDYASAFLGKGLVMSASFDYNYGSIYKFLDLYDGFNYYDNHGAQPAALGDHPSQTVGVNFALDLTNGGYVIMQSNPDIEFTKPITVEAWIYPLSASGKDIQYIIRKGKDYQFYLNNDGNIYYSFGEEGFGDKVSKQIIPSNKWTHVAITCGPTGLGKLYINGKRDTINTFQVGSTPGKDTLFIGTFSYSSLSFNGYVDAVKISNYEKTEKEINSDMFKIVDQVNQPIPPNTTVSLNFDYANSSSTVIGGTYYYVKGAKNSLFGINNYVPVAPIIGNNIQYFSDYNIKYSGKRIPQFNTAGYMEDDSLDFPSSQTISTVQLFLALNHENLSDLKVYLQSPSGDSVLIWDQNFGSSQSVGHIITVFDDNAQDPLVNRSYVDFGPYIKPVNSINSLFAGKSSKGIWKLKIVDLTNGNTGYLYAWGLRINSVTGVKDVAGTFPNEYILEQNYPNPFNPSTIIKFSLPKASFANLTVYDMLGRQIKTLVNGELNEGYHQVELNGNELTSGIYIYKLNVDNHNFTKKMLLLK